jgi:drug/metabolite transporter (DMT)-like permease
LVAISYASIIGTLGLLGPAFHEGLVADMLAYRIRDWLSLAYLGVFGTAVGFVWYYQGIKALGPAAASQYINFVPASAVLMAYIILDEPITASLAVGLVLVVTGVYLVNSRSKSPAKT